MAAPELYAPRRPDAGRARAAGGSKGTGPYRPSAGRQPESGQARRRGLVYRALTTGVALSAIGGFSYYAWLAYSGERTPAAFDGTVVTIAAAVEPVKIAPENPGGLAVHGSELEFFDGVTGQRLAVRPDEEYVLPPPEAPIINPEPELFDRPPPLPMELAVARPDNDVAEVSPASTAAVEADSPPPTAGAGVSVPPVLSAPMLPLPDLDPGQMTEQAAGAAVPAADPLADPAIVPGAQPTIAAADAPPTAIDTLVAAVDQGIVQPTQPEATQTDARPAATIQLASMRSRELAEQEWQRLSRLMPDLLANREPIIRESTNNDRTYFRVSIAAVGVVEAAALCAEIKTRSFDCIVHD